MSEPGADVWEKWRAIVSEQIASGQSVAAFCKERGVTSSQLFAWKKRLREAEKAQFVEVQVRPSEPLLDVVNRQQARAIEVKLYRGRSIVVEPGFDADHLRALLAVTGARSVIGLPSLRTLDGAQVSRIWLAAEPTDMRCSFDRLAERVRTVIGQDPLGNSLFVFRSRSGNRPSFCISFQKPGSLSVLFS